MSKAGTIKANIARTRIAIKATDAGAAPTEIELLRTGMWDTPYHGMFMVTPDDLRQYVENFKNDVRPSSSTEGLPIDREHESDDGAAGWIMDLEVRANGDGESLWGTKINWTPKAEQEIVDGEFKFFSPEFCPDYYEDPEEYGAFFENVLIGGGITNRPLFKDLKPLMASDSAGDSTSGLTRSKQLDTIYIKAGEKSMLVLEEVRKLEASALDADQKKFLEDHKAELTADERTKFSLTADDDTAAAEAKAKADKEAADKKVADDAAAEAAKTASDRTAGISASDAAKIQAAGGVEALLASADQGKKAYSELQTKKASDLVDGHVKRGAVKASSKDRVTKLLLASEANGTRVDLEALLSELPDNKNILAGELGGGGLEASGAVEELNTKTTAYMKANEGVDYAKAQSEVLASDKDLNARVNAERSR